MNETAQKFADMFASMDDEYMRGRAADVRDVSRRVLSILTGVPAGGIESDGPVIVAADDLAPSETVQLDKSKVLAFVTAGGSASSHTAILARTMGIPAVIGVGGALTEELDGREAAVDGFTGEVYLDPDEDTRGHLQVKARKDAEYRQLLSQYRGKETRTKDGQQLLLYANIGSPDDMEAVSYTHLKALRYLRMGLREGLPVYDSYAADRQQFEERKGYLWPIINATAIVAGVALLLFIFLVVVAGKKKGQEKIQLNFRCV